MCGSDWEDAHVFTRVLVFGMVHVCVYVSGPGVYMFIHTCLPVLVSLHVVHTHAHSWSAHKPPVHRPCFPRLGNSCHNPKQAQMPPEICGVPGHHRLSISPGNKSSYTRGGGRLTGLTQV